MRCQQEVMENSVNRLRNPLFATMFLFAFSVAGFSSAARVYITPDGSSQGDCSTNPHTPQWFNSPSNWGSGSIQIGPGTTVLLCGTFNDSVPGDTLLYAQGSGASGSPITILFDSGASLTNTNYWGTRGAIFLGYYGYFVINGGTNGVIQNTGNGTGLANQQTSYGIYARGGNTTIENLTIANLYVHTEPSDTAVDQTNVQCINARGPNITIANNVMHDAGWCIVYNFNNGDSGLNVYNNAVFNIDHGFVIGPSTAGESAGTFSFHDNNVYNYTNWDVTSNAYHHDGFHCFSSFSSPPHITAINIYNNSFVNNKYGMTAHIFLESAAEGTPCADSTSNIYIYNNFLYGPYNMELTSGNLYVYNNTMIGLDIMNSVDFVAKGQASVAEFENNALTTAQYLVGIGDATTATSFTGDYNSYANGGTYSALTYHNLSFNSTSFSGWQALVGGDAHSTYNGSLLLGSSGVPQPRSPTIRSGANLTSLGITPLDRDTSAGNTRIPVARPAVGPWDGGAYAAQGPNSPTGLNGVVK